MGAAQCAQTVQTDHTRIVQGAQTFHVKDHNFAQQRQLGTHFQGFVQLLVVLDEEHRGARVLAQVMHLGAGVGGVNAIGYAAGREHRQISPHPFDDGVGQNRGALAFGKAQAEEACAQFFDGGGRLVPGPAAPQAQMFLPQPHLRAAFGHAIPKQRGHGLAV